MKTINFEQKNYLAFLKLSLVVILLLASSCSYAGNIITGKVVDESGNALPGVNVTVKGTRLGTTTDLNGNFIIQTPDSSSVLVFAFVGYSKEEVKITSKKSLSVSLTPDIDSLDEVVVTGYGRSKKCDMAGSVNRMSYPAVAYESESKAIYYNPSTETYALINETGFRDSKANPLSTFSIDVDRASYSNIKRFLNNGEMPPADAVRIEEMINYFEYDYPQPKSEHPFSITTEYTDCPWQEGNKLLHIGLQGKKIAAENLPPSNLVFLIDVSGSMDEYNKLPLLKSAFKLLVNSLRENDKVAIVVYAGAAGLVLSSTRGDKKTTILNALERLQAGGSTAGAEGIRLAYETAIENFIKGGNNRVILATDGDFNVGVSNENELENLIEEKRSSGVYLTCLGFGMGNYKDSKMEILADKGNGNYAYINDIQEAEKTLVSEFGGTLFTIAKDVKLQIEFNPSYVKSYRLVGYENRMLNEEDFKDDKKDAGELGSGHTVTAIYEIIPVGVKSRFDKDVDPLKYQSNVNTEARNTKVNDYSDEVATIKFRYKKPDGVNSIEMVHTVKNNELNINETSANLRFSASVAMFGMLLRNSEYKGTTTVQSILELGTGARGEDEDGYRAEFLRLVKTADKTLSLEQ